MAVLFTSGLHGPRVRLTIPKTFYDFEVISVICFLPRIIWNLILLRGTSDWPLLKAGVQIANTGLGLFLFVIGRCIHFDKLNCICHLSDHFSSSVISLFGEFDDRCLNLFCDIMI